MAHSNASPLFPLFLTPLATIAASMLLIGCQQESMVSNLPSPNFNGPTIARAETPAPQPRIAVAKPPSVTPPAPIVGIPRDWIPSVAPRHWVYIVIHHSATPAGGAARFDREHREKGWDELGYHFVIGNGTDTGDGQVEVGSRWPKQKWGAHDKTPDNRYNDFGIGICLVGNFQIENPTPAQMRSAAKLVAYLMQTYHISAANIKGHGDTKQTECPGRNLHVAEVVRMATQMLAKDTTPKPVRAVTASASASGDLMIDSGK